MQTTNWREKFAGTFVLLIGLIMLGLLIFDFISSRASSVTASNENIVINRFALLYYLRVGAGMLLSLIGAFALFTLRKTGWVLCMTILILHLVICGYLTYFTLNISMKKEAIFTASAFALGLLAVIFLFLPGTREKYRVSSKTILLTLGFLLAIGALFFFVQ